MSFARASGRPVFRPRYRLRRVVVEVASVMLGVALLIWSLTPVYNMLLIALDPDEGDIEFEGLIWPPDPSLHSFHAVLTQGYWLVEDFWRQFGNSIFIGLMTTFLTVVIGSLASFAFGRMRVIKGWLLVNAPLLTYAVPASFLVIPFYRLMANYGLSNTLWAIVAANVTFAAPYAILILQQYAKLIPMELDEAAQVDGASPVQMYRRIYLPLMTPALTAVGTFALLARLERVPVPVCAAHLDPQHDRGRGHRPVLQQRRGAVELHDGHGDHLFGAADRDLLRASPLYGSGPDEGRPQGLKCPHVPAELGADDRVKLRSSRGGRHATIRAPVDTSARKGEQLGVRVARKSSS